MKREWPEWAKWVKVAIEIALIAGVVWLVVFSLQWMGLADGCVSESWVMCKPGDYINVRNRASTRSEIIGRLDSGDSFRTDWEVKDGFIHAIELPMEQTEGWVSLRYVVFDAPEWKGAEAREICADGRVAVRKWIDGDRVCWLKPGATVQVFYESREWSYTNRGYIRTEYLK